MDASAAPRIAAAAGWRPSSSHAARAIRIAGSRVPGPRMTAVSLRCRRTSPKSTRIASVKSTSSRPMVAITSTDSDSSGSSTRARPAGPSSAPKTRKIATCGKPTRSTAPESSEATRITSPIRASAEMKVSWAIAVQYAGIWRSAPAGC